MTIYIVGFIFSMLLGKIILGLNTWQSSTGRKKLYLILFCAFWAILCGCRSTSMTYDTSQYELIFKSMPSTFSEYRDFSSYLEPGYVFLCFITKLLGGDFQIHLVLCSLFIVGGVCSFIYKYSPNVLFSTFLILCFPYYYTSYDIMRFFLGITFFLFSFKYIQAQNFVKFLLLLLLGISFHYSIAFFLPFYFIKYIKINRALIILSFVLTFFISNLIVPIANMILGPESIYVDGSYWIGEDAGGVKTSIMYCVLFFIIYYQTNNIHIDKNVKDCYVLLLLLLALSSILFVNARMMIRFMVSFMPFMAVGIPIVLNPVNTISRSQRNFVCTLVVLIALAYHAFLLITNWQNIVPYVPYWEN